MNPIDQNSRGRAHPSNGANQGKPRNGLEEERIASGPRSQVVTNLALKCESPVVMSESLGA